MRVLTCLLFFVLCSRRIFTGSVIDSRRDGEDVLFKILWSDNDSEEMTGLELGQAMEMYSLYSQLNKDKENNK